MCIYMLCKVLCVTQTRMCAQKWQNTIRNKQESRELVIIHYVLILFTSYRNIYRLQIAFKCTFIQMWITYVHLQSIRCKFHIKSFFWYSYNLHDDQITCVIVIIFFPTQGYRNVLDSKVTAVPEFRGLH